MRQRAKQSWSSNLLIWDEKILRCEPVMWPVSRHDLAFWRVFNRQCSRIAVTVYRNPDKTRAMRCSEHSTRTHTVQLVILVIHDEATLKTPNPPASISFISSSINKP